MESIKQKLVIIIMCVGSFLCMIDTTIMVVSLPKIETYMNVQLSKLSWALNLYTIIFAVFTILLSRIAEIKGKNKIFILGLVIFTIGSCLSGSATNCNFLIVSRGIQGFGAAIIIPLSMTIAISLIDVEKRHKVIGVLGGVQGLGAAVGPVLGGSISQYLGWRWSFFVNVPFLIVMIICSFFVLNLKKEERIVAKLDIIGAFLSMVFLFSLTLGIIKGNDWGWTSDETVSLFVIAGIAFVVFIICEKKVSMPMINLNLFKNLEFNGAAIVFILVNFFLVGVTVVIPTYLTKLQNTSEFTAALLITPISLVIAFTIPIGSLYIKKISPKYFIFIGFISIGIGYYFLSRLNVSQNYNELIFIDILLGFGAGLLMAASNIAIASDFRGELLTASQSVANVLRQFGIILVVSIFLSVLTININNSKQKIIFYAKGQVMGLSIPNKEKTTIINGMEEKFQGNNIQQASTPQVSTSSKEKVDANIQQVQSMSNDVKIFAKNELKNSFLDLYKYTYPFVFVASLSFIMFAIVEKKKKVAKSNLK
ncbi:MFS transporter [uncultured Clostridium sp.]|uniref:MFS transporter n=1 Tax=uncultured Clostridium sp. TaxID=59620 RepID=UPI00260D0F6A|nr:MFS transporter [uncultured Clostridium sp.]